MSRLSLELEYLNTHNLDNVKILIPAKNRFIVEIVVVLHLEDRILLYDWSEGRKYHFPKLYLADWQRVDASSEEYYQVDPWSFYQPSRYGLSLVQRTFWDYIDKTIPILQPEKSVVVLVSRGDVSSRNTINEVNYEIEYFDNSRIYCLQA